MKIKISSATKISWPQCCVLCCREATKKDGEVPYCDKCYTKVERLRKWKDNVWGISLVFGVIGMVLSIIGTILEQGLHTSIIVVAVTSGFIFMGIVYVIIRLLLLPLQLIFHSKLARPGMKILKSKQSGVARLKFSNSEYADKFQKVNQ